MKWNTDGYSLTNEVSIVLVTLLIMATVPTVLTAAAEVVMILNIGLVMVMAAVVEVAGSTCAVCLSKL